MTERPWVEILEEGFQKKEEQEWEEEYVLVYVLVCGHQISFCPEKIVHQNNPEY